MVWGHFNKELENLHFSAASAFLNMYTDKPGEYRASFSTDQVIENGKTSYYTWTMNVMPFDEQGTKVASVTFSPTNNSLVDGLNVISLFPDESGKLHTNLGDKLREELKKLNFQTVIASNN